MKIVFCGNPDFAQFTFDALLSSSHEVVAVVCSPDKPRGRGRKEQALPVKARALAAGIPVLQPASLKDGEFLQTVRALRPDALVVVAFRILPRELFALPRYGSFNVHPSLLPRYRGPAPLRWTLLNGDTEGGVSIIQLTEQIDGGGILAQERAAISSDENYGDLHDRYGTLGAAMLVRVLNQIEAGERLSPLVQDETKVTKAPKLFAADFQLNWLQPRAAILNRIRALAPHPGASTVSGDFTLKLLRAAPSTVPIEFPGVLVKIDDELHVGTADGAIQLKEVKPAGKRAMSVADFLRGRPQLPQRFNIF